MKTTPKSPCNVFFRILAVISLILYFGSVSSFGQENKPVKNITNLEDEWWKPILQKHKIDVNQFNFKNTFDMGMNDNFKNICLELGTTDSLNSRIVPIKNLIIIQMGPDSTYWIQTNAFARHYLDKNIIDSKDGIAQSYRLKDKEIIPVESFTFVRLITDIYNNSLRIDE